MADITSFIQGYLTMFLDLLVYIYATLDSIQFYGFSLLDFSVALFLLGLVVPVLLVLVPGRTIGEIRRGVNTISREANKND